MDDPGVRSALQSAFRDASAEVRAAANRSLKGLLEASRPNPTGGHAAGTNQVARRPDGKTARLR
jgi:hypothetical protein